MVGYTSYIILGKVTTIAADNEESENRTKSRYVAKVCDFGLARVIENGEGYYVSNNVKMPFKWSAPECLRHRKFSFKSDCYSMAILLYELFHFGEGFYCAFIYLFIRAIFG